MDPLGIGHELFCHIERVGCPLVNKKTLGGIGVGLSLVQGFVALALQLQNPTPNQTLANALWITALVTLVATLAWFWPHRRAADENVPTAQSATQSGGSDNQLQQVTTGNHGIVQQAERAVVVQSGGTYYETVEHQEDERFVVDVAPKRLVRFYEENTDLQADLLFASFKGKWMRLRGPVSDVSAAGTEWIHVSFPEKAHEVPVRMFFNADRWRDQLILLDRGQENQVLGQISKADRLGILLDPCELE